MTPPRLTAGRLAELQRQLSARDYLVLATLRRLRVATAQQIERLCFTDATALSNARMARRTLHRLHDLHLLARLDRPPGGTGGGAPGHVYTLDLAGLRLSERREDGQRTARRPWPLSRQFLDHQLAVSEWYVRLVEADRHRQLELLDYHTEPASWRPFTTGYGQHHLLKPDAYARLGKGAWEEHLFLEIDRGTERAPALRRQLDLYLRYWATGVEQHRHGLFPQTVWIVPDAHRHAQLVDLLGELPADTWPLFRVTTTAHALDLLTANGEP